LNKWIEKYNAWCLKPLGYNFNRTFVLISIIYFISVLFDFCLTYITFTFDSDGFFRYEVSYLIKQALGGSPFFVSLIVIFVMSPLIIVYCVNEYYKYRYHIVVNCIRVCLFSLYAISVLHIIGGFTNFFYLISLYGD